MKNEQIKLFSKGNFSYIDTEFIADGITALRELQKVQEKFNKNDTDSFINELRDQIVGDVLGFDMVNIEKHGFDCKKGEKKRVIFRGKSSKL